jgi:hypothetical protein
VHIILYNPLMFAFPKYVLTSRHHTTTPCRFTHGTLAQVGFTRMARVRVSQEWGDGGGWTPEWISIHLYNRFIEITTYIYNIIYNTYIYIRSIIYISIRSIFLSCCFARSQKGRLGSNKTPELPGIQVWRGSNKWWGMIIWLVVSKIFSMFHSIWDNPSHWLLFFKMVIAPPTSYG